MNKNHIATVIGALFCILGIFTHSSGNKTIGYVFAILAIVILLFSFVSMLKQNKDNKQ